MKRLIAIAVIALMAVPSAVMAQQGRKEVSPVIEGKQKVRKTDYDSIWKFTTFNGKSIYYVNFDYRTLKDLPTAREFDFGTFLPVMNYLTTQGRTPMLMCAVYSINPSVEDKARRMQLKERAELEAIEALNAYVDWMKDEEYKNKKYEIFRAISVSKSEYNDIKNDSSIVLAKSNDKKKIIIVYSEDEVPEAKIDVAEDVYKSMSKITGNIRIK